MHPIVDRLKKRKLVQWALAYLAGAWLLYQLMEGPGRVWGVTDAVLAVTQVVLGLSLLVVLTLAWYHGERGVQRVTGPELLILGALFGLGAIGVRLVLGGPAAAAGVAASSLETFDVSPSLDGVAIVGSARGRVALSPDGSRFVFVGATPDGGSQLWERSFDDLAPRPIAGTADARMPVYSADGSQLAFQTAEGIWITSAEGGSPRLLARGGVAPTLSSSGDAYFRLDTIIARVPVQGGEPVPFTTASDGAHTLPDALPDDRGLLLTIRRGANVGAIAAVGPEGGAVKELFEGTMARYSRTGHIVYSTAEGRLMAVPFDVRRLRVSGPHVELLTGVDVSGSLDADFALSRSGALIYQTREESAWELVWVDRSGRVEAFDPAFVGAIDYPAISPDGEQIAIVRRDGERDQIWLYSASAGFWRPLTLGDHSDSYPVWDPGGRTLTYTSDRDTAIAGQRIWSRRVDGTGQPVPVLAFERRVSEFLRSPDRQWSVFRTDYNSSTRGDIYGIPPGASRPCCSRDGDEGALKRRLQLDRVRQRILCTNLFGEQPLGFSPGTARRYSCAMSKTSAGF